jgi:hypothetical protein
MDKMDKVTIQQAFHTEEMQRHRRSETENSSTSDKALGISSPATDPSCDFCHKKGHIMEKCFKFIKAQKEARKPRQWNKAKSAITETAGNVSLSSDTSPTHKTHYDWNADSGATSHMTPHRHWFKTYEPYSVPIKLADNTIIHSAGVGNIIFVPIIEGKKTRPIEFTRVLHVPRLQNNLLSVLFLTKRCQFEVNVNADYIKFIKDGRTLFVASINDHNAAFLDGRTESCLDSVNASTMLPLDYSLCIIVLHILIYMMLRS